MRINYWGIVTAITVLVSCNQTKSKVSKTPNYDSLRIELEKMHEEDQEIRRILVDSIGLNSPNSGSYIKKMLDIDHENQRKIKLILNKFGWIEQSKIGVKAADAFFFTIQHSDMELIDKWFPNFKSQAGKGEANRVHCAMMEDRLLMWKGKRQVYGTQASDGFRPDKKMAIWPIEDAANVNERRRKIGFKTTIEEDAKNMNAIFNMDEKLPDKQH